MTGHAHVRAALRDTQTYSSDLLGDWDVRDYRQLPLEVDPPRHHMYRSALTPMFVRPRIESLRPQLEQHIRSTVDEFESAGGGDFVRDVALKSVVRCLAVIFGRPNDVEEWASWGADVWTAAGPTRSGDTLHTYLERVYTEPLHNDSQDYWAFLKRLRFDDRPITRDEFFGIAGVSLAGGRDTIVKLESGMAWDLLNNPDHRLQLAHGSAKYSAAIQEYLRYFTPLESLHRITPDQQAIDPSERDPKMYAAVDFASANYDDEVFEHPDQIDFTRSKIAHLAFGFGPHSCIGNHVAEIEADIMLHELVERISRWSLTEPADIEWHAIDGYNYPRHVKTVTITTGKLPR